MDYFLLRYGIEDVGKYTQDGGVVAKYYGVLTVYQNEDKGGWQQYIIDNKRQIEFVNNLLFMEMGI